VSHLSAAEANVTSDEDDNDDDEGQEEEGEDVVGLDADAGAAVYC